MIAEPSKKVDAHLYNQLKHKVERSTLHASGKDIVSAKEGADAAEKEKANPRVSPKAAERKDKKEKVKERVRKVEAKGLTAIPSLSFATSFVTPDPAT